ncbi:HNH endonuclease [Paramecium bursaria Chlorella virus 1]|uniref:HNH nuclease domain-containing protein n=1 Tax=Paramecium bursaria Chlorella virus 1 TaxID=10506 RepID=Q98474_PBCV1|nr:HNH endonuclease [Paramecium bursaria Chlorella virus 1]AAC96790.2 hypothetical protein [Paramecium bursaria Chlorella virus 1]
MCNEWNDIPGILSAKKIYQASIFGDIRSVDKTTNKTKIISQYVNSGYLKVGINKKIHQVHNLIALAFIKKPDDFNETFTIDHIDRNPLNNSVSNLRWVNKHVQLENRRDICRIHIHSLPVIATNVSSKEVSYFSSLHEAAEKIKGANFKHISACINKDRKTHAGYIWSPPETLPDKEGEEWEFITKTPRYNVFISNYGRIGYEFKCGYTKKVSSNDMLTERGVGRDRYPSINISKKEVPIHILVWKTFMGDIPEGVIINHKDHNKQNASLDNLEILTRSENAIAAHDAGKYDDKKTMRIKVSIDGVEYKSLSEASKILGISRQTITYRTE